MKGITVHLAIDGVEQKLDPEHSITLHIRKDNDLPWQGLEITLIDERPDYSLDPTLLIYDGSPTGDPVFKYRPLEG